MANILLTTYRHEGNKMCITPADFGIANERKGQSDGDPLLFHCLVFARQYMVYLYVFVVCVLHFALTYFFSTLLICLR